MHNKAPLNRGHANKDISLISVLGKVSFRHLGCRSQKLNKNKKVPFLFFLRLLFEFIWDNSIFTLLSWNISVTDRIIITLTWGSKREFPHVFLSGGAYSPEGQCYFAAAILCLIPRFPKFFLGETYICLLCHMSRLFSGVERGSTQSFHKSTHRNQREDFILTKEDRESPV